MPRWECAPLADPLAPGQRAEQPSGFVTGNTGNPRQKLTVVTSPTSILYSGKPSLNFRVRAAGSGGLQAARLHEAPDSPPRGEQASRWLALRLSLPAVEPPSPLPSRFDGPRMGASHPRWVWPEAGPARLGASAHGCWGTRRVGGKREAEAAGSKCLCSSEQVRYFCRRTDDPPVHEKTLSTTSQTGNAHQTHSKTPPHTRRSQVPTLSPVRVRTWRQWDPAHSWW